MDQVKRKMVMDEDNEMFSMNSKVVHLQDYVKVTRNLLDGNYLNSRERLPKLRWLK